MKFVFLSAEGNICDLARRISLEGNDVKVWIKDERFKHTFDGIVKKIDNWERYANRDTIFFIDHCKLSGAGEKLRKANIPVINGSKFADKIELDRRFGQDIMDMYGIKTPIYRSFTDFKPAIAYIKQNKNKRHVFKPSGNISTDWTYVGTDSDDMIEMIENKFSKKWPAGVKVEFLLQDFIDGIEVSTEVWFGPKGICNINSTMEEKKFLTGNLGPSIGCAGNVVWNYQDKPNLFNKTLGKLTDRLAKEGYVGCLDINCIVSGGEPYGIEWTSRPGYDALQAWIRTIKTDLGQAFSDLALGNAIIKTDTSFAAAVRVTIPPYPFDKADDRADDLIKIDPKKMGNGNYWFFDAYMKNKQLYVLGIDGIICVVSDKGKTIGEATAKCYKNIEEIKSPRDIMYRTDIGNRVPNEYKLLKDQGLL